jgi:hypothetical protein
MLYQITGGCLCGALKYTCNSPPKSQFFCYCTDCQSVTGSPFAPGILVKKSSVTIEGCYSEHQVIAKSGRDINRKFCTICGSRVFDEIKNSGTYIFNVGSLDNQELFKPQAHFWVRSKPNWYLITDKLPQFEEQPNI